MKTIKHGTVEELPSGRHRVRFRIDGPLKTVDTYDSEDEAEAARSAMATMLSRDGMGETSKQLGDYGLTVLADRELGGEISDTINEGSRWKIHIVGDALGALPVNAPDDVEVKDWLKRLKAKGLARQTRLHCLNILRNVLSDAIEQKLHPGPNPCIGVRLKKEKRTEEPWTYLSLDEQASIVAAAPKPLDAIVEFAVGSGLRSGEQVALRLADVHIDGNDPHVIVRYGGPPTAKHPKGRPTKSGKPRRVPLFGRALGAMHRWLSVLPTYCDDNRHALAFPGPTGAFRPHDHVLRWAIWKGVPAKVHRRAQTGILTRAGITRDVRWHDLRHTCASSLVSGWWGRYWSLAEVCDMLGHSSITTTERYAHLADTALKKAARETGAVFHTRSTSDGDDDENPSDINGAGHGSRTRDLRLGNSKETCVSKHAYVSSGTHRGTDLLAAVARGDAATARSLAVSLAHEILTSQSVALAGRVLAGGEHAMAAAVELAEMLAARVAA